ncbi:unnamed protein product [Blepharisma stoltei]|uniref:Uncharacterized protein n=1 Tax=Blepharisma stoltei TaxID=1481888 RepID=A0AAU9I829_9CILI|nr:unnamed protein product [Blepharisma stoltei]
MMLLRQTAKILRKNIFISRAFSIDPKQDNQKENNEQNDQPKSYKGLMFMGGLLGIASSILLQKYIPASKEVDKPKTRVASENKIGGPWKMIDSQGKQVTDQDFRGSYVIYYFGFTRCPDICPTSLKKLSSAMNILKEKGINDIKYLFVSLDAERDTPEEVGRFTNLFHKEINGLLVPVEDLPDFLKKYKLYSNKIYNGEDYMLDHTSYMYLFDKNGQFMNVLASNLSDKGIARSIEIEIEKNK